MDRNFGTRRASEVTVASRPSEAWLFAGPAGQAHPSASSAQADVRAQRSTWNGWPRSRQSTNANCVVN